MVPNKILTSLPFHLATSSSHFLPLNLETKNLAHLYFPVFPSFHVHFNFLAMLWVTFTTLNTRFKDTYNI
jgi:hypothetical protein